MQKRIDDFAQELGVPAEELLAACRELGFEVDSVATEVDVDAVKAAVASAAAAQPPEPAEPTEPTEPVPVNEVVAEPMPPVLEAQATTPMPSLLTPDTSTAPGPVTEVVAIDPERADSHRPLSRTLAIVASVILVVALGATYVLTRGPSRQSKYLDALKTAKLASTFTTPKAAVGNAKSVCTRLDNGKSAQGYRVDQIGVQFYCKQYLTGFKVIPTPQEQQVAYLKELQRRGVAGKFASDAAAVANAHRVCDALKAGGPQQGLPQDQAGVQVYCSDFLEGFKVLETKVIQGTFNIYESDPGGYFPSIASYNDLCEGADGYSDISSGTQVVVKNAAGTVLASTELGQGHGSDTLCTFSYSVTLTEGESTYTVSVGRRGELQYTWAQISSDGIHGSLS
jgi:uncharacterized protein DUF732